jgi:hypothetical protein
MLPFHRPRLHIVIHDNDGRMELVGTRGHRLAKV